MIIKNMSVLAKRLMVYMAAQKDPGDGGRKTKSIG
jgi:hypothetical protein